jgi:mannose-6-phosphate isomerase-like protein (cupin superfamily)
MSDENTTPDVVRLDVGAVYQRIRAEIATTDEISFKLLGLVPLFSGAGILSIAFSDKVPALASMGGLSLSGASALNVLCLFAATVTLGLFRWELRNVQTCIWLISRAKTLEEHGLANLNLSSKFFARPKSPDAIGKERAEKLIYVTTVAAWLALPFAIGSIFQSAASWQAFFVLTSIAIGTLTALSAVFSKASVELERPIRPSTKVLPMTRDAVAPDGSDVRILLGLAGGGMAHFELAPGATSKAVTHRTVEEIWYILSGRGQMWRQQGEQSEIVDLRRSTCVTIPLGTHFQFQSQGDEPLAAIGVTMPPWPRKKEAVVVPGAWPPTVA